MQRKNPDDFVSKIWVKHLHLVFYSLDKLYYVEPRSAFSFIDQIWPPCCLSSHSSRRTVIPNQKIQIHVLRVEARLNLKKLRKCKLLMFIDNNLIIIFLFRKVVFFFLVLIYSPHYYFHEQLSIFL